MNVVIAALSAPMQMNGVSRHAAGLAAALLQAPSISEVHFIAGRWQKQMFQRLAEQADARLHMHFVSAGNGNFARIAWYRRELPQIASQLDADVVHFACPVPMPADAYRCPTVVSLHDLYPFDIPENFGTMSSTVTRWLMSRCIRRADGIACVSESTRERLQALFPSETHKSQTIPNVVEQDRSSTLIRPPGLAPNRPFLLCVAQHRANKRIPFAIRIFEHALRQGILPSGSQLLVVGISGPETAAIRSLISRLKLDRSVLLLSGLSDGELQWCYRQCKLLLAPSVIEGFGLPIAEAILSGCPAVCADIQAFREVGGASCHYVPWGDEVLQRYVSAIRDVLARPRPAPAHLPQLCPRVIGQKYASFYERLVCHNVSEFCYATATRS